MHVQRLMPNEISTCCVVVLQIVPHDVLAELLTIIEYESHLRSLRPREFIALAWTKHASKLVHPDLGGAANLNRVLGNTNHCIAWMAREVVDYARRVGPAAECIEYFVRVARECLRRNNFNTFFQIVAALGSDIMRILVDCLFDVYLLWEFRLACRSAIENSVD